MNNKIDEIFELILRSESEDIGLLSGLSGMNLFLYAYDNKKRSRKQNLPASFAKN